MAQQRCPRCGGNLFQRDDIYSSYHSCLQCGLSREIDDAGTLDRVLEQILKTEGKDLRATPGRPRK